MHPQANIMIRAARRAGDLIIQALDRLDKVDVQEKGRNDFVTEIDLKVEETLIYLLRESFPNESFLTEEQGEIWGEDRDSIWVIDPIDGTLNFIHGFPYFAISIAKKVRGRVEHGVIYNPASQDIFAASRGEGATLNGRRIRISKRAQLQGALLASNAQGRTEGPAACQHLLDNIAPTIGALRRTGSIALDLAHVAAGQFDAFICDAFYEWDVAAGMLIVREAGGIVTDLKGSDAVQGGHPLIATTPKLLKPLLQNL